MINFEYFCLPALYVKDISSDVIHMVGTDAHDRLYLDANGNIQYLNLQSGGGTPDDYSFVLDEDGHNQNNLPFSKKEQELYGLDEEDAFFTNMDMDTINMLYLKKKSEADKDIIDARSYGNRITSVLATLKKGDAGAFQRTLIHMQKA